MQSPRNISEAIKPISRSAVDRAMEAFEENGGILSTGKAIKLGIPPGLSMRSATMPDWSGWNEVFIDSPMQSHLATLISSPSL
jgi:hypothetical protein